MKPGIIIRMGATRFTADVRAKDDSMVHFNLNAMSKDKQRHFIKELVIAYREASL